MIANIYSMSRTMFMIIYEPPFAVAVMCLILRQLFGYMYLGKHFITSYRKELIVCD